MLSVVINKSVQSDSILINDFSRIAPIICNKLNGSPNPGCRKSNVVMAERSYKNESASSSSNNGAYSNICPVVTSHLSRVQNKRKQNKRRAEESIYTNTLPYHNQVVNPVHLSQHFRNFSIGVHPNNLVYRNFSQAVLYPNLTCFHRPNRENQQRQIHTTSDNGLRFWEKVFPSAGNGFVFSVMSYNVLAQDLIVQHPHLYYYHNKQSLEWPVRWSNLVNEITNVNPDILCMQEVQGSHLTTHFSYLSNLGYRGIYKQRTGVRTDGCAIYYKHELVTLIEYTTVEYNQPNISILDRDNVAIVAKFAPKKHPTKEFVVATTHLLYNPKRQDVRLAQTQLLLTEVERIAFNQGRYLPIIVTGDLNSTPDSAVYQFITKGKLTYENLTSRSLQPNMEGPKTGKRFLPSSLRITDQCQHADLIPERRNNKTIPRSEELKLIELKHSERGREKTNKNRNKNDTSLFSSGTLSHKFALHSVYGHNVNGDIEGTTFQDEWVCVDYIFYSKRNRDLGRLMLLERFKLPTRRQLGNLKIPNKQLGSDHLSLIAKFELTI